MRGGEERRRTRKRLKISVPHFDNSAIIKTFSKTLTGRCMNPEEQEMKALISNLSKIWKLEERVVGSDLGFGKFQFDFDKEEDIEGVLKLQSFHFDYWMFSLARWQPKKSSLYPSEITFWVRVIGVPVEFKTVPTFESIGEAIGRAVAVDLDHSCVQVVVDAFKEICFETKVDFTGGEFYDETKNTEKSPEKKREGRDESGAWYDGGKYDDRARSYKGREQQLQRDVREEVRELAKAQADGTEVISDPIDADQWLAAVHGMQEDQEEIEEVVKGQEEESIVQEKEEMVAVEEEQGPPGGDVVKKQGLRKRLFKPTISTAGSTKM
ncbi:hypothetical protein Bca4012_102633 [Brassica carinata]